VTHVDHDLPGRFKTLVEIHSEPEWLWSARVAAMVDTANRIEGSGANEKHGAIRAEPEA
jgi:hypothetical protein